MVYLLVEDVQNYFGLTMDSYPGLRKLHEEVATQPNIKKWVEERPKSDYWIINNNYKASRIAALLLAMLQISFTYKELASHIAIHRIQPAILVIMLW